jgi:hypothetical protein
LAVEKVQVVGAGQMGSGIAQVAAQAGLAVHLTDVNEGALQKGVKIIKLADLADGYHRRFRDDCLPGTVFQVSGQAIDAHPRTGDKLIMLDKIVTTSNGDDLLTFPLK